jgi:hypothetical protein
MSLFHRKTPEEKFIAAEMKKLEERTNRSITLANYAGVLEAAKASYEKVISLERLAALRRRKARVGDDVQKQRIHDACVGLLAVQEAEFELSSIQSARDFNAAQKDVEKLLRKMFRMSGGNLSITSKDFKAQQNVEFENTSEPVTFSDRAELVDERFVENIISGLTFQEALDKTVPGNAGYNAGTNYFNGGGNGGFGGIDFSGGDEVDFEKDVESLKEDADTV